jgi:hypothetical protein
MIFLSIHVALGQGLRATGPELFYLAPCAICRAPVPHMSRLISVFNRILVNDPHNL